MGKHHHRGERNPHVEQCVKLINTVKRERSAVGTSNGADRGKPVGTVHEVVLDCAGHSRVDKSSSRPRPDKARCSGPAFPGAMFATCNSSSQLWGDADGRQLAKQRWQ